MANGEFQVTTLNGNSRILKLFLYMRLLPKRHKSIISDMI
jgi:hypothetical protein